MEDIRNQIHDMLDGKEAAAYEQGVNDFIEYLMEQGIVLAMRHNGLIAPAQEEPLVALVEEAVIDAFWDYVEED